ncbi:ScbR family autoregulator-binding transcription factor [Streptomyces sp. NPDC050095]|uniref:ScbR family autoregulator-binding transcription factor n=1 Tax=unclassified Streptomyces TaxID=2593676 RepID=UPI003424E149
METRESILRAAAEVFDESGYAGASINRILERAGVTAGSLYFHFKSKEALARVVIQEQANDLAFPEEAQGLQSLVDMTGYLASQMQHNTLFRAGVRLAVEQSELGLQEYAIYEWWSERFRQELVVAREQGQLMPGVDEAAFASMLVATFTGTQIMSQVACGRADLPKRLGDMWRCMLPALTSHHISATLKLPGTEEEATA